MGNLRVNIGKNDFVATFQHRNGGRADAGTICTILRGKKDAHPKEMKPCLQCRSRLALTDQFNKNIGRKISLTRALSALSISKAQRTMFWQAYFKMRNDKW